MNCAILGSFIIYAEKYATIGTEATVFGLGSGIGWFTIVGITPLEKKLDIQMYHPVLRGLGITFIITGLMGIICEFHGYKVRR